MNWSRNRHSVLAVVLLGVLVGGGLLAWKWQQSKGEPAVPNLLSSQSLPKLVAQLTALESRENHLNETVWAKELLAEQCGQVFEQFWDSLNATTDKLAFAASFQVGELIMPDFGPPVTLPHGLQRLDPVGPGRLLAQTAWREFLLSFQAAGWRLEQTEWRHRQFDPNAQGGPGQSRFDFAAHLLNASQNLRAALAGDLVVDWTGEASSAGPPTVKRLDARHLTLQLHQGETPFQEVLSETIAPPAKSHFIDPLIVYDLDGDGLSEIILAARNLVYHRLSSANGYQAGVLCREPPGLISTAVIADFDGDGSPDFLCAKADGLFLYQGVPPTNPGNPPPHSREQDPSAPATGPKALSPAALGSDAQPAPCLPLPSRHVWAANPHLKYAQVLTCGDVDGDGDLDVWLGQYKGPYDRGQMPTPYYDANDGNPSYLLLNDGHGGFTDRTESAGLAKKRWRRTYSASLVDLDDDGDLDLLVVSDFAGLDLYANDGRGHFKDVTKEWVPEAKGFGMAHTFADFNRDGCLDLLVMGMNCPTPQRLDHLGLTRSDRPDNATMRSRMAGGNRLLVGRPGGGFETTPAGASLAHSGWSWGCSSFDFDNDGWPDVYIANGHESKQSVRDYESEFWLHDIYVGNSYDDVVALAYFGARAGQTRAHGWSYGGYDKNRLFLNAAGASFVEAGYVLGVGLEADCRNVVTDDLDGDGRVDLLVTTFEAWPAERQTLRVFRNRLPDAGNWIGFRLREESGGGHPVGVRIRLYSGDRVAARQIITGDSYRSQHANSAHFGLGNLTHVDRVEVRWTNGRSLVLRDPGINRYHDLRYGRSGP